MQRRLLLQATGSLSLLPMLANAQDKYPSKPISWICPYAAGGGADSRAAAGLTDSVDAETAGV